MRNTVMHNPALCRDHDCACHTDPAKAVATSFPAEFGNPHCCNRCAIVPMPMVASIEATPYNLAERAILYSQAIGARYQYGACTQPKENLT